jgi:hypothetical protein
MHVQPADLGRTGPEQRSLLARTWQHRLNRRLGTHDTPQDQQWAELLAEQIPNLIKDSFLPNLTKRLENLDRAGFDATSLVQSALMIARCRHRDLGNTKTCSDAPGTEKG